jgi:hypothetical protein
MQPPGAHAHDAAPRSVCTGCSPLILLNGMPQVGFFDVVAIPLFHNYTRVFRSAKPLFANVLQNYNYWAGLQREAASTKASSESG